MVVLSCIAFSAACSDGMQGESNTRPTEVELVISDPATAPEELAMLIDFVSYRITCPDSDATPSYDDSVDIAGNFEAVVNTTPAVWTLVTDLPLSICTISMWVFYEDEVICSGSQSIPILEASHSSAPGQVNIDLVCSLSVIPPSGDLEIEGSFELVHGNYCPQLFWLGAFPTPGDPFGFTVQTSYIDMDNGCGQNCDPQTCDFTQNPPVCNPAQDPGLSSTLSAPARNGSFGDDTLTETSYACDPFLPGPTEICVLVSDGDNDCDQTRCITIECPDLCEGVDCTDFDQNLLPIECTWDRCNPLDGSCSNDPAPDGVACNDCSATCQAGGCSGAPFAATVDVEFDGSTTLVSTLQQYDATLVNPYSGESVSISGNFRLNDLSYEGIGTADVLSGITTGGNRSEVLLIQDSLHPQAVCGVETINALNGFDVLMLADGFITLQSMVLEGGSSGDILWANAGNDTLRGNNGVDRLDGGPGNDTIEGGNGDDTITLWPGSGFDSIDGGDNVDTVEIYAIPSQIKVSQAANQNYAFDISYLGTPMAQIREVELVVVNDGTIDLATCTGSQGDVCNLCGNDALDGGESCDDGNNASGDGCAADCTTEY